MIPAKVRCPDNTWTKEYSGYLMTSSDDSSYPFHRTKFVCVDKEAEVIAGTEENRLGAVLSHVRVERCGEEYLPCTYDPEKEITCVVCSK